MPSSPTEQPAPSDQLRALHQDFAHQRLVPLWTATGDLMPHHPAPRAVPHVWRWGRLLPLAERAGELVPVGRGGERRALALANPGLGGLPYATSTLWAAIQYLGPGEQAPEHRHTQNAFRFVIEGEGVWTVVDGDPVAMRRGDLLLTPGRHFHGHHNATDAPMAWLDGLDVPFTTAVDAGFFEYGAERITDISTPARSRSERLWAHPGLRPATGPAELPASPLAAYRWEHTDAALTEQLALADEGLPGALGPDHAAVRFTNPTTGGDILPTIRAEFHRLRAEAEFVPEREVGSAVWQVFQGSGTARIGEQAWRVSRGDLFVVPSWAGLSLAAAEELDLFRFSDAPILERLDLATPLPKRTP
ncbi:cupin domain-containing protein [Streptomyces pathocidini]|uniref:Cupin domain-containing protein n=1 Tax=Streptomyces pathocidini TaxID=1650571 RepID=A0ABW7UK60_9ACTN|nr:cupin domain-containing protein [Streptomyces pathocidini]